jgi:hypothetical protein
MLIGAPDEPAYMAAVLGMTGGKRGREVVRVAKGES